jgi:peptidoglycan hydrolase-like protein with peptidoglycan-binding domain
MFRPSVCLLLAVAIVTAHAEDSVRSTQEELRRRNVFFGDIDGRRTDEYAEAVRRYQRRKGLTASGQEDRDTLRSLGQQPRSPNEPPPKELEWPAEPVLKSDSRLDVLAVAKELSQETGVATASVRAPSEGEPSRPPAGRNRVPASRNVRAESSALPSRPSRSAASARLSFRDSASIPSEVNRFISQYLSAVSRNRLEDELEFYADRVDYFGNRQVDRRIVEQTLRKFYQRWPKRDYSLVRPVGYALVPSRGEIVLTYQAKFSHGNGSKRVKGQTLNRLTINAATADPRIVAIEEKRVRQ